MPKVAHRPKSSIETVIESAADRAVVPVPESIFGKTFTFRLRQHNKKSNFSGLWELAILDNAGNIAKLISDADALNFCIDNLMGELETEGY